MLVEKGYLKKPLPPYAGFGRLFGDAFFVDGKPPTSDFAEALLTRTRSLATSSQRWRQIRRDLGAGKDMHLSLAVQLNRFFRNKSALVMHRDANWDIEAIPEADLAGASPILREFRHLTPAELASRRQQRGRVKSQTPGAMTAQLLLSSLDADQSSASPSAGPDDAAPPDKNDSRSTTTTTTSSLSFAMADMLECAKLDLLDDIIGKHRPLSAINYLSVTRGMMTLFGGIEFELWHRRNSVFVRIYEQGDPRWRHNKPVGLVYTAMAEQDDECLTIMAEVFEVLWCLNNNYVYWGELEERAKYRGTESGVPDLESAMGMCSFM